jgi:hypothetical protein
VIALAVVTPALVFGVGSHSSASMDRQATVEVSAQSDGVVSLWEPAPGESLAPASADTSLTASSDVVQSADDRVVVVVVENQLPASRPTALDTTGTLHAPNGSVSVSDPAWPTDLDHGESGLVTATVDCGSHVGPTTITVEVEATSSEITGTIEYDATVVCTGPSTGKAGAGG